MRRKKKKEEEKKRLDNCLLKISVQQYAAVCSTCLEVQNPEFDSGKNKIFILRRVLNIHYFTEQQIPLMTEAVE